MFMVARSLRRLDRERKRSSLAWVLAILTARVERVFSNDAVEEPSPCMQRVSANFVGHASNGICGQPTLQKKKFTMMYNLRASCYYAASAWLRWDAVTVRKGK